jgi:hypothetical protein
VVDQLSISEAPHIGEAHPDPTRGFVRFRKKSSCSSGWIVFYRTVRLLTAIANCIRDYNHLPFLSV